MKSLVNVYRGMLARCYNRAHHSYHNYGGRGIYVCKEWCNNRQAFLLWAQGAGYVPGLTLDRINNDGPYSPSNCHFVTWAQQHRNTRRNIRVTINGITKIMADWATAFGIEESTLSKRRSRGMSPNRALSPGDLRLRARHGTNHKYQVHRCRCDLCRAFNAQKARVRRRARLVEDRL